MDDRQYEAHREARARAVARPSAATLIRSVASDAVELVQKEIQLAKKEMSDVATRIGAGAGMIVGGIVLCMCGLVIALLGAVWALALVLPLWLSAVLIGGGLLLLGVALVIVGKETASPENLMPNRAMHSLKKDKEMVEENLS